MSSPADNDDLEDFSPPLAEILQPNEKRKKGNSVKDVASWIARSESPWVDFYKVFQVGLQEDYPEAALPPAFSARLDDDERKMCSRIYGIICIQIGGFRSTLPKFLKQIHLLIELARMMTRIAGQARANDTGSLKKKRLEYIRLAVPGQRLIPEIPPSTLKSASHGWFHKQIAELLMPAMYYGDYQAEPDETIAKLQAGTLVVNAKMFPRFMYKDGKYNKEKVRRGFGEGELLLRVFKHIFTSPSSADSLEYAKPKTRASHAKMNGLSCVTPGTLAYAAVQTHFMLDAADDWRTEPGLFKKEEFFYMLYEVFSNENDPWARKLLDKLSKRIFGPEAFTKTTPLICINHEDDDYLRFLEQDDDSSTEEDSGAEPSDGEGSPRLSKALPLLQQSDSALPSGRPGGSIISPPPSSPSSAREMPPPPAPAPPVGKTPPPPPAPPVGEMPPPPPPAQPVGKMPPPSPLAPPVNETPRQQNCIRLKRRNNTAQSTQAVTPRAEPKERRPLKRRANQGLQSQSLQSQPSREVHAEEEEPEDADELYQQLTSQPTRKRKAAATSETPRRSLRLGV